LTQQTDFWEFKQIVQETRQVMHTQIFVAVELRFSSFVLSTALGRLIMKNQHNGMEFVGTVPGKSEF
jgi:hypothetical protein